MKENWRAYMQAKEKVMAGPYIWRIATLQMKCLGFSVRGSESDGNGDVCDGLRMRREHSADA